MKSADGKDRESVARKLRELAQLLEGECQPAIVERRGNDLRSDLATLHAECDNQDIADFVKSVAWMVGCLTTDGRAKIIQGAMESAAKLNEHLEPQASWREVVRLPILDRDFCDRTAGQLRHLAGLLLERKSVTGMEVPMAGDAVNGRRPAFGRDQQFLVWNEESIGPAKIRDKWNTLPEAERRAICPSRWQTIGDGNSGREVVVTALKKAKKERKI